MHNINFKLKKKINRSHDMYKQILQGARRKTVTCLIYLFKNKDRAFLLDIWIKVAQCCFIESEKHNHRPIKLLL